jgi:hypothetical protein
MLAPPPDEPLNPFMQSPQRKDSNLCALCVDVLLRLCVHVDFTQRRKACTQRPQRKIALLRALCVNVLRAFACTWISRRARKGRLASAPFA